MIVGRGFFDRFQKGIGRFRGHCLRIIDDYHSFFAFKRVFGDLFGYHAGIIDADGTLIFDHNEIGMASPVEFYARPAFSAGIAFLAKQVPRKLKGGPLFANPFLPAE